LILWNNVDLSKIFLSKLNDAGFAEESLQLGRMLLEDLIWDKNLPLSVHEVKIEQIVARLLNNEPIQFITGIQYFMDLKLKVSNKVLIPRPETEELCREVLAYTKSTDAKVLDIGTGSGAIVLALKSKRPNWSVAGIDLSVDALEIAKENAIDLKLEVDFSVLDILSIKDQLPMGKFDLIVSNPPYISEHERELMSISTVQHEPHMALFAHDNGLEFYKHFATYGQNWLIDGGQMFLELNEFYADEILVIFQEYDWKALVIKDMQDKKRIIRAILG